MNIDELDQWGVRVAQWAAPDETVLAAQITRAYAAGGRARQDLFRTADHVPGGLGGGIETLLPELLDALAYAAGALKSALGSQHFGNVISVTALLVGMRAQRSGPARQGVPPPTAASTDGGSGDPERPDAAPEEDAQATPAGGTQATPAGDEGSRAGSSRPEAADPPGPTAETVRAALRLYERLRAQRVDASTAEELAAVLTVRLSASERPTEAAAFLDALVANEPTSLVPGPARHRIPLLHGLADLLRRRPGRRDAAASSTSGTPDDTHRA